MDSTSKAVIPAAGRGTRLRPITNYLSKAMLPLGRKPVLQHIVEELKEADIPEIAIVARPEDEEIFSYFGDWPEVQFIRDDSTTGPGGAVLQAEQFVDGEDFFVVFADAPAFGQAREEHLKQMIKVKKGNVAEAVLSIYRIPASEASSRGVVILEGRKGRLEKPVGIADLIEKPSLESLSEQWASTCRYLLDSTIFDALRNISADKGGELQLTTAVRRLIEQGQKVVGLPLPKNLKRYDTGNFEGYFEAVSEAIKRS